MAISEEKKRERVIRKTQRLIKQAERLQRIAEEMERCRTEGKELSKRSRDYLARGFRAALREDD